MTTRQPGQWLALTLVALLGTLSCTSQPAGQEGRAPQPAPLHLLASTCRPVNETQRSWLGSDFAAVDGYAIACPVAADAGTTALILMSVDAYAIERDLSPGSPAPQLPKGRLYLPSGREVGTLPFAYPFDPPVSLDVTFSNWREGLPRRVELNLEDPAAGGNRSLSALQWDEEKQRYAESSLAVQGGTP